MRKIHGDSGYRDVIKNTDDLLKFASAFNASRIPFTWTGLCIWVDLRASEMTAQQVQVLHALGARYSQKRDAYYLRSDGSIPRDALECA